MPSYWKCSSHTPTQNSLPNKEPKKIPHLSPRPRELDAKNVIVQRDFPQTGNEPGKPGDTRDLLIEKLAAEMRRRVSPREVRNPVQVLVWIDSTSPQVYGMGQRGNAYSRERQLKVLTRLLKTMLSRIVVRC